MAITIARSPIKLKFAIAYNNWGNLCYEVKDYKSVIAILPRCRNKGLGKSLLIHLFAQAKADGYQQIFLSCAPTNDNALHLYQQLGFEQVGVHIIQNWIMKKVLI